MKRQRIGKTLLSILRTKEKKYTELIEAIIDLSTGQFFEDSVKQKIPIPAGSCVFLEMNEKKYIVTAAHVLEGKLENIYLILGADSLRPGGIVYYSKSGLLANREDDHIDIGIIVLDEITINYLEKFNIKFLKINEIEFPHKKDTNNRYLVYGFPVSGTDSRFKVTKKAMVFETSAYLKDYQYKRKKISINANTFIKFPQKTFVLDDINVTRNIGSPHGLSGSGLWIIRNPYSNIPLSDKVKLIGILTTWFKEDALILTTDLIEVIKIIENNQ